MAYRRAVRFALRLKDSRETRAVNSIRKAKERSRRDARMLEMLRNQKEPYSPAVMSWLSRRLDKPSSRITSQDIQSLLG
ncbi:MAG: hypothetical protein J5J06_11465 [Phycisphaerae bacterium]|nr:hypothetical protein [Phycisphaerae bacterium]